jgi:diaminohydroxyphosphoribosylaminopyrimidine deaminase / 5-amino-6-(5-phosphoribosylamino)uracil reductase
MTDTQYMQKALQLAKNGYGFVNPNPLVGAIIVKDDIIIGEGYHKKFGDLHAERNAILNCTTSTVGATIYVTLEPCCHYGKTPPCTKAIVESGITKVVIGSRDPNPLVAGMGVSFLKEHGITVVEDVLKDECDSINEVFFHYILTKTPFVIMKYAMTIDGKIATHSGASKWITGSIARDNVHKDRHKYAAIMIGVQTAIQDDPSLTCRIDNGKNPVRIICDTNMRLPISSNIVKTAINVPTIIATTCSDLKKQQPYIDLNCKIIVVSKKHNGINLNELMEKLSNENIDSILLEGGGTLNWSALESGIVNKVQAYISPKIFGGNAKTPVLGMGVNTPSDAFLLTSPSITTLGDDILIESLVTKNVYRNS